MGIRGRLEYMAARLSMRSDVAWAEFRMIVWVPSTCKCMMLPTDGTLKTEDGCQSTSLRTIVFKPLHIGLSPLRTLQHES